MSKLQNMRGIEIKKFRAVSSGLKTFDELFGKNGFAEWLESHRHLVQEHIYEPTDFLWHEGDKETWGCGQNVFISAIKDEVTQADVDPYDIIEFPGGMFLVATGDENNNADLNETVTYMMQWIEDSDIFEYGDFPKSGMCNMPNPGGAFDKALGIAQQQIYLPLKIRSK
ncbi:hypothetical protein M0651_10175 [Paenibacillus sp. MBLB2552]|uniref:Uncharacterized protein n=1 Tax=Paenibacillus mellifer TaxID=2937794 RepID=A0A9X1Y1A4_9BACL|nr:hypothetical protein [Paenibacillus mellifer]MCK8487538.1 hypothetical protein [Paenibacillus mellifer]